VRSALDTAEETWLSAARESLCCSAARWSARRGGKTDRVALAAADDAPSVDGLVDGVVAGGAQVVGEQAGLVEHDLLGRLGRAAMLAGVSVTKCVIGMSQDR
jgi:hypothetical protein